MSAMKSFAIDQINREREVVELLHECRAFIDNYADGDDGDDGRLVANRAARLVGDIDRQLDKLSRGQEG